MIRKIFFIFFITSFIITFAKSNAIEGNADLIEEDSNSNFGQKLQYEDDSQQVRFDHLRDLIIYANLVNF